MCRLLLNTYISQKVRVKWENELSCYFNVRNGVKQGGVISPVLFCVYIDGLLEELKKTDVGCYMGSVFAGAFAYADDLTLLAPTVHALKIIASVCEQYARDFHVLFNSNKKSKLIVFKAGTRAPPDPGIKINGNTVKMVNSVTHLGHVIYDNIYNFEASKCIRDFNRLSNLFFADFKDSSSEMRNYLFFRYCTNFYGSQILPLFDNCIQDLYRAWRVCVRRVWRLPWTTHSIMLPHIAKVMTPQLWFAKRCVKFIMMANNANNTVVNTIVNMAKVGSHSIMGGNIRFLTYKYDMDIRNIIREWKNLCEHQNETIRLSEQVRELCNNRDRGYEYPLSREESIDIIKFLCTD